MAALTGNELSVRTLIELGAKINEKGSYGFTPLLAACMVGSWDTALLLLQKGAEADPAILLIPEEPELRGVTPLILAAAAGRLELVSLLVQKGVDINRRSDAKLTALIVAEMGGHTEVAKLLRQQGATISEAEQLEAESARHRGFDSSALSDLKNVKTSLEAYFADHQSYPETLAKTAFLPSSGVDVRYEPVCDNSGCNEYVAISTTAQGAHEYRTNHGSAKIMKRSKGERFAEWME